MTPQEIRQKTDNIATFLVKKELKNAFDAIVSLIDILGAWDLKEQLEQLKTTYKYMLQYMLNGVEDPERNKIYNNLLQSVYELNDKVSLLLNEKYSSRHYFQNRQNLEYKHLPNYKQLCDAIEDILTKISLNDLLEDSHSSNINLDLEKQSEDLSAQLFKKIWLSDTLNEEETGILKELLFNKLIPVQVQCLVISALTISLKEFFRIEKLLLLFDAYEHESEEIRQRALIGILLILYQYDKRLYLYPAIADRINHLAENPSFVQNINMIILQFILSKETEKITKQITEEVIPEMMKISPKLGEKLNLSELTDDLDGKNPEWQNLFDESGLTDKLQKITELQMEGADVMHSSFANLKTFPFFNEISNWFLPFTPAHTSLRKDTSINFEEIGSILSEVKYICNSDKYSLCFSISQMPESYRKMMTSRMSSEMAEMIGMEKENNLNPKAKQQEAIANQYIHDLYRFYKVHPRKKDFEDIFNTPLTFHKTESIGKIISDKNNLLAIGEYYFSKNQSTEAKDIFKQLIVTEKTNAVLYQKIGYCEQISGNIQEALDAYLKSELIDPHNSWTLKKIAACYRLSKKPEKALSYYQKVETTNPDNLSVLLNIGHCYLELKKYQEALNIYFKVEYINTNGSKSWRPIAWCSFLTGKFEQSIRYYEKIMDNNPEISDLINYGHALLATKNTQKAIELYKSAISSPQGSEEKFIKIFSDDIPELLEAGIAAKDIPIILDEVLYSFETDSGKF